MSKQDRQGVRTPADIERKYDLGGIVSNKQDASMLGEQLSRISQSFAQYTADTNGKINSLFQSLSELEGMDEEIIKAYIDEQMGDVNRALDEVMNLQNQYISGAEQMNDVNRALDEVMNLQNQYIGGDSV